MATKSGAGKLIELIAFDERAVVDDGYGNLIAGDFVEQFRQRAAFTYLRGNEGVDAAAQASAVPVIITIRNSEQARAINTAWQARDVRKGTLFNIKTIPTQSAREMLELLCESGVATG